jgi:hypothetical protein
MNHDGQTKLALATALLLVLSLPLTKVVQARPSYAAGRGNDCSACHNVTVTGRMEVRGEDSLLDLGTQLDGQRRGPLKTFRAFPGQALTLAVRVLDGSNRFAVQIKDFEKAAQRSDANHRLVWSPVNGPANVWTRHEVTNPPYFTKDNGANGGFMESVAPITYTFEVQVEPNTPLDVYELVFAVPGRRNGQGVYQEERFYIEVISPFDLNSDGIVDCADICMVVDHWHTDDLRYDLGPMPGGDGIVDGQDLLVLSDHLFEDHRLVAHWMLDETEGFSALDSVGVRHGELMGNPTWQPDSGQINGALLLNGTNDYISTAPVLNPGTRPFSAFAWVQGGAPGQVILSQNNGQDWLLADAQSGTLKTELKGSGRRVEPLTSDVTITDGTWHHLGLVWNGAERILYMDDVEVARDAQAQLANASEGLFIGAGASLTSDSFWAGMIDDVRIYDRAIVP